MSKANVTPFPHSGGREGIERASGETGAVGNIKVTREDWLNVALDILVSEGVEQVKVLNIAERLSVSRSSFYWYFKSRQELLDALLAHWEQTNTASLLRQCNAQATSINAAVFNLFICFMDGEGFSTGLDFAVREWARRSGKVRRVLDRSDQIRLEAIMGMFERFGYDAEEAAFRARILYFMQVGYNFAELSESFELRVRNGPKYMPGFTGKRASADEIATFQVQCAAVKQAQ